MPRVCCSWTAVGNVGDPSGDSLPQMGRAAGDAACALAFDVYLHRLARETAAMTAATGGLDLLVLTGGVGEHAWQVRAELAAALAHLGLALDDDLNRAATADADITASGATT